MEAKRKIEILEDIIGNIEKEIVLCEVNVRYAGRAMITAKEGQLAVFQGQKEQWDLTRKELEKKLEATLDELRDTKEDLPSSPVKKAKKGNS